MKNGMDWRAIGQRLGDELRRDTAERIARGKAGENAGIPCRDSGIRGEEFLDAIMATASKNDFTRLIQYLESDKEIYLSQGQRDWMARILKHRPWKKKRGPRKNRIPPFVAVTALDLYRRWQLKNTEAGISNWRLSNEMKDESCRYAVESWNMYAAAWGHRTVDFEVIRQMMEGPKDRLK
jgi:hypothetical protein